MKYVCGVCGYIYDDAEQNTPFVDLPDNWVCPLCGAPKSVFTLIEEEEEKPVQKSTKQYICGVCGYVYDDAEQDIPFKDLPDTWVCPLCGAPKSAFEEKKSVDNTRTEEFVPTEDIDELTELNAGEMSALFSNLARGCEKQYQEEARKHFQIIADYFEKLVPNESDINIEHLASLIKNDIDKSFVELRARAEAVHDRGALRSITWGEKVTKMAQSLIDRYQREGDKFLSNTGLYICTVCGFLYVGDNPPELCPVCKVPNWKFRKIDGRVRP